MDVLVWRKGLIELGVQRKIGQKNKTWWGMLGKGLQVGAFRCMAGGGGNRRLKEIAHLLRSLL